jgi:phage host-nuclease inhibitor protein Gam
MTSIRAPRSTDAAAKLLERYAEIEGQMVAIENVRNGAIAAANKAADAELEPLITQRLAIRAKLEPWWVTAGAAITEGKRKSAELGGCMIGTRAGRDSLAIVGNEDAIAEKLAKRAWAKPLVRIAPKLDKKAILKSLGGVYKKQLAALGLTLRSGDEVFFIERAEQAGTIGSTGA